MRPAVSERFRILALSDANVENSSGAKGVYIMLS
jgi:hypothetical protein